MDFSVPDYDDLMKRYLDVCNQAMVLNKDRFPFKQILGAAQKSECGKVIEVNIVDDVPAASYAMTFSRDGLAAQPHSSCSDCRCDRKWVVRRAYLEEVAKDPENYIQNPAKIDWEWMYDTSSRNLFRGS